METPATAVDMPQADLTPEGFASRLEKIADQLCTGELSAETQANLKHALFEDIGRLRLFVVAPVRLDPAPAGAETAQSIEVPRPAEVPAFIHDAVSELNSVTTRLAAELRESINRIEEHSVRLSLITKPADPAPAGGANPAPAAGV